VGMAVEEIGSEMDPSEVGMVVEEIGSERGR